MSDTSFRAVMSYTTFQSCNVLYSANYFYTVLKKRRMLCMICEFGFRCLRKIAGNDY